MLTDTDSVYLALATDRLEDAVAPELGKQFELAKAQFLESAQTKRQPALFKCEWKGEGKLVVLAEAKSV